MNKKQNRNVLSLFSSAGIGELGIKKLNLPIIISNELLENRCGIYKENYPEVESIQGDIWEQKDNIISEWKKKSDESPFLIYATPPCQGMSSNGAGKIINEIRKGSRKPEDPRNRLIIPTMEIIKELKPDWVLLENVPTMKNTIIRDQSDNYINIIEFIEKQLGNEYVGCAEVVNCADYGIPQVRKRLITIFTKTPNGKKYFSENKTFLPPTTHNVDGSKGKNKWVTLRESISTFPPLDAKKEYNQKKDFNAWHIVPIMNEEKYWWLSNTPEGTTAYNNQCVNKKCMYQENQLHGSSIKEGLHSSNKDTPIYCEKCGELLPRPSTIDKSTGIRRLIKGYDTAYRRMKWDEPAPTITQNFIYEASDKKVHPSQTRVLSVYEAMTLQTITDYDYKLSIKGVPISINLCAEIIGESVPPKMIELICSNILKIN